jgi:nucleotide-binding universal stress UspA family protein
MKDLRKITLCFDNSDRSFEASQTALDLAKAFGSEVTGIHGYNAIMHEGAFRIMEPTLPAKYQTEEILKKQRTVHKNLINVGMEKISLSYLKPLEDSFRSAGVPFSARVKEGKNYLALMEMMEESKGDLVVIGASGFNRNGRGFLGGVCLRVLRGSNRNFLVIKSRLNLENPKVVVALDGSNSAISALATAKTLAEKFKGELHLIYVFDSSLHKDIFERLKESLIQKEGFSFNSKEQEKIHDQFIDKGLARVGSMILDKAEKEAFPNGARSLDGWGPVGEGHIPRVKKVLAGHIYSKICEYASEEGADLICMGRTGRHFAEGMDIGSVSENVVRFSPCSVIVSSHDRYEGWQL